MKTRFSLALFLAPARASAPGAAATEVSIKDKRWHVNGRVVNAGSPAEGLLMNVRWVDERDFGNVVIEIANEYPQAGFAHPVIRSPQGQAGLLAAARETAPHLLFTASGYGDGRIHPEVAEACDFLTPHWNGTKVEAIPARLAALQRHGKPIVCNEDDKTGSAAVAALKASVAHGAAYGLMLKKRNQTAPFRFEGAADDPEFYAALEEITSPKGAPGAKIAEAGAFRKKTKLEIEPALRADASGARASHP